MALEEKDDDFLDDEEELEDEEEGESEDTQTGKFLLFHMDNEDYGVEIRYVTEIIGMQSISEVPDMPAHIKGVINLRGKVIPVVDLRLRFGLEERPYDGRTCTVVVNFDEKAVGLIVDRVSEVMEIPSGEVVPPPEMKKGESSRFIQGMGKVGDEVKILLNMERLLFD